MSYFEDYETGLDNYAEEVSQYARKISQTRIEHHFECLNDWNKLHSIDDVREWFTSRRENCKMTITDIPLNECSNWSIETDSGNLHHDSGEFFSVHGIRVNIDSREVGVGGWDQPILTQVGFDGGILGILRQRFQGIPHYLIEAKAEPGNYEKLQLSPTLQATFSNLRRAHEGRKPNFSHFFENPEDNGAEVIYNQWMSEDGGRLHLKRNRGMLVEVREGTLNDIPDGFIWLSMWQIKELLNENAWVNPHIRGIISHL